MADSCGQVNAASIAAAQYQNVNAAAQMSKGAMRTQTMPSTMQTMVPTLANDFSKMTIQAPGAQINQQPIAASVLPGSINQSWSTTTQMPVQHQPVIQSVPQQQNPALLQQIFQQQQQQQHAMVLQRQQQAQQHFAQQQHQMMFLQQHQQHQQQFLQQQQQQLQFLTQQQQMVLNQPQQQQQQQIVSEPAQSIAETPVVLPLGTVPTTSTSQSIFEQLRAQEEQQETQQNQHGNELEEPAIQGDISQYLHDNFEQMFHASQQSMGGGLSASTIDQMAQSENEKWKNSKFVNFMQRYQRGELEFTENDIVERDLSEFAGTNDFDDTQDDLNEQLWTGLLEEAQEQDDEGYEGDDWQQDWIEHWKNNIQLPDGYEALQAKIQENIRKYTEEPATGTFERGVELFDRGAIQEAITLFEQVTHHDPQHSDAWMYLGKSFAQLDQDVRAIECLERCLSIDSYNLNALLMLGVSLSNSFDRPTAVTHLFHWIANHPDFAGQVDTSTVETLLRQINEEGPLEPLTRQLNEATIQMFVDASKINDQDAELQTVLGVLYHIGRDFQNSISAFTAAVKLQPNNPELWNKLGAAIANGGRHEDATRFYLQALQLRPNYLRAQVNCGTAYYNLQAYHKAYPIFLNTILTSPDAKFSKTPQPHLWPMLRQSFAMCQLSALSDATMMRDIDLLKKAMKENGMAADGTVAPEFPQPLKWE